MKLCPNCGTKNFDAEHRGSFSSEPCSNCGGTVKSNPFVSKDKAQSAPKPMPMAKKPAGVFKKKVKAGKKDPMYGC